MYIDFANMKIKFFIINLGINTAFETREIQFYSISFIFPMNIFHMLIFWTCVDKTLVTKITFYFLGLVIMSCFKMLIESVFSIIFIYLYDSSVG